MSWLGRQVVLENSNAVQCQHTRPEKCAHWIGNPMSLTCICLSRPGSPGRILRAAAERADGTSARFGLGSIGLASGGVQ